MTVYNVYLPLFEDPDYSYSISLQGQSYTIRITYNERCKLYFLSLLNADDNPVVQGMALVPNYPIMEDYPTYPLTGFFWLQEKAEIISEPYKVYPDKIDQYYDLYYTYITED